MSKELILMEDVAGLGIEGDLVKVAEGYARNFLLPKKLATRVTSISRRQLDARQAAREVRLQSDREKAEVMITSLDGVSVTIPKKAAAGGTLYGSVQASEIADALQKQDLSVNSHMLKLPGTLGELGVYDVVVKLHPEFAATIKVWVVEE
jgi:large subunit ribosomal protein L9